MRAFSFRKNLKYVVSLSLIIGLVLTMILQANSNRQIQSLRENTTYLYDDFEISELLDKILFSLSTIESAQRAYVITGDSSFLLHTDQSKSDVRDGLTRLNEYLTHHEMQEESVEFIRLTNEKIAFSDSVIDLYNNEGTIAAFIVIENGRGHQLMEEILGLTTRINSQIKGNTQHLISANDEALQSYRNWATGGVCLVFILILTSIYTAYLDIKIREKNEVELNLALDAARDSLRIKEQFMANMSHEIRTPLNAMLGYANLLKKSAADERSSEYLQTISKSGENLLEIVNDILDFSKIEAGMIRIEKIPFSLQTVLDSSQALFEQKANDKQLSLEFKMEEGVPEMLTGDPHRLTQILNNLIGNAIKFTHKGKISVTVSGYPTTGKMFLIKFVIEDSGIGIDPENFDLIFRQFSQANASVTRQYGGTGLGLSIVKNLVKLQRGTVEVESIPGKGSVFTVQIPYEECFEYKLGVEPSGLQNLAKQTDRKYQLLLVEDNLMNQKLAQTVLTELGYGVQLAENGEIAVRLLQSGAKFDLVLMDIQMPVMDGYQATQIIRQELKNDIPIVAMTAHAFNGEREKCIHAGMNDYLTKPFTESHLDAVIRRQIVPTKNPESPEFIEETETDFDESKLVTDLSYLISISKGNLSFVVEMIDIFITQNMEDTQALDRAYLTGKYDQIRRLAHKMKTSVRLVGMNQAAERILENLETLEDSAIDPTHLKTQLDLIRKYSAQAIVEVNAYKHSVSDRVKTG